MTTTKKEKPGCLGAILGPLRALLGRKPQTPAALPYKLRDDFLSPAEFSYYKVLTSVLGPRATVCPKVRLSDILFIPQSKNYMHFFGRIAQRHVDFVVCDSTNMKPALIIEFDDASHNRPAIKEKDRFLDETLHAAGLPILRVRPQMAYSREEVIDQLKPLFVKPRPVSEPPPPQQAAGSQADAPADIDVSPPLCPKCDVPMVLRVASRGKHKGMRFYGCPNFPQCREVIPVRGARSTGSS